MKQNHFQTQEQTLGLFFFFLFEGQWILKDCKISLTQDGSKESIHLEQGAADAILTVKTY